ncbi:MAG: tetratricopeptide repeat protein [Thermosynechococcaceae cyanobacterium]
MAANLQKEPTMNKLNIFGIILASLTHLVGTESYAQLDLFSPIEVMREQHCLDHPELINEPTCAKYYRRNPSRVPHPSPSAPKPRSTVAPRPSSNLDSAADALFEQGKLQLEQGNYQGAMIIFNRVIAINPKDAQAYVGRGSARYVLRDFQGALEDANRAIRLDSSLANAYAVRCNARQELREYQGALEDANRILILSPTNPTRYFFRATVRYALGEYQGALEDANRSVHLALYQRLN